MTPQVRAKKVVNDAKLNGLLPIQPPNCEVCGVAGKMNRAYRWSIHFHHWSYLPEHRLDVLAVCPKCHCGIHSGRIPDPRPQLYAQPTTTATDRVVHRDVKPAKPSRTASPPTATKTAKPKGKPTPRKPVVPHKYAAYKLPRRPPPGFSRPWKRDGEP